jgi:hypothetical protein
LSESSALWLQISPDRSWSYIALLTAAHLLASVGTLAAGVPTPVQGTLCVAIIASWIFHLRRYRCEHTENRAVIMYGEQEGWRVRIGEGSEIHAKLLGSSVSTRWITILHFRTGQKRFQSFVIFPDSLDAEDYRRLRMILRITEKTNA